MFDEKLGRARRKEQYLRIQAGTLASSHPDVALKLLDRYFRLHDDFDHAQAHVDRATALLALGRAGPAVAAYEAALAREAVFPKLTTQAYLDLPFIVATHGLRDAYGRAIELLHQQKLPGPAAHYLAKSQPVLMAASAEPWERALAHAVAANVASAAGRAAEHGDHYRQAVEQVAALPDAEERAILEATLRVLPVPAG